MAVVGVVTLAVSFAVVAVVAEDRGAPAGLWVTCLAVAVVAAVTLIWSVLADTIASASRDEDGVDEYTA